MDIISPKPKLPGTLIVDQSGIFIFGLKELSPSIQNDISKLTSSFPCHHQDQGYLINITDFTIRKLTTASISQLLKNSQPVTIPSAKSTVDQNIDTKPTLDFDKINKLCQKFSDFLKKHTPQIAESLKNFETYNVIIDEIERSVDLLENLNQNKEYFYSPVSSITTFLPLNQPLYATVCFGIIPSLMAKDVAIRPPTAIHPHFQLLMTAIKINTFFKNITISYDQKQTFLDNRKNKSEVVIFTGTYENSQIIYRSLKPKLFILNGAGHNPVVVTPSTDLKSAVTSTLRLVLQNQGQDCAAPNAILVHQSLLNPFKKLLLSELKKIENKIGPYQDPKNIVGPNTEISHLVQVSGWLVELQKYIIYGGTIDISQGIIFPTVLEVPLSDKAMLTEFFAPIIVIQPYLSDTQLAKYFQHPQYYPHAMYVTIFGDSPYVNSLTKLGLHTPENIIYNSDLHLEEHGYLPYGGLGPEASCLYLNGNRISGATLPQRDIYKYLVSRSLCENGKQ